MTHTETTTAPTIDPITGETHAPGLYAPVTEARQVPDLGAISAEAVSFYEEAGYLSVARAFSPQETADALAGLMSLIQGENPAFKGIMFEASARDVLDTLTPDERQDAVRKLSVFVEHETRLRAMAYHPALLAVLRTLLGDDPVLCQDMALLKPPGRGREKPWHQDLAYFNYAGGTRVVGVWIALDEATVENGCMQLLPGQHRGVIPHFTRRDWQICDATILGQGSTAAPLQPGGALLFDGLLPHGTPHNPSTKRRRALQFHYAGANAVKCAATERMARFGSEGKDVTC